MRSFTGLLMVILLVTLVSGCYYTRYQTKRGKVSGLAVGSPDSTILSSANADLIGAEAKYREVEAFALQSCAEDSSNCKAAQLSVYGPYGAGYGLDVPAGYTMAGIQAVTQNSASPDNTKLQKEVEALKGRVKIIDATQDEFLKKQVEDKGGNNE